MSKNRKMEQNRKHDEANTRNAAWRKLTYAQQVERLKADKHWFTHETQPPVLSQQATRILANIAKHGESAVPADVEKGHLQDAGKSGKQKVRKLSSDELNAVSLD